MIGFIITTICCVSMVVTAFILCEKIKKLRKENKNIIKASQEEVANLIIDKTKVQERVKDLEDGINKQFGISVRNEVTKVECVFNKLEMVIIMAGVYQLIEHSGNIDDKEAYIKLYKKAQEHAEKMEELDGD